MFSVRHLNRLLASGKALGLSRPDLCRFLWSYYGSRLAGAENRRYAVQEIVIRNQARALRLAIRTNFVDADVVDEIFARGVYRFDVSGVKTILDLGGNIGLASVFFHLAFPGAALACVEPVPDNARMIERNFELNGVSARVFKAAVGCEDGTVQFQVVLSDPVSGTASYAGVVPAEQSNFITVPMLSVPTIMKELGWSRIDLLKLDIEGGERELLARCPSWLEHVGAIIGEGHRGYGKAYTWEDMAEQLRPFGFRLTLVEQRGGAFIFVADSNSNRVEKMPSRLVTGLQPIREARMLQG
jgi:FkbM family methyltransferase